MLTFVLLKGWGFRANVMVPLQRALQQHFPTADYCLPTQNCLSIQHEHDLRAWRDSGLPAHSQQETERRFCYIGWSLGGLLASLLAALPDARTHALITLGTNRCFVAHEHWPCAMPRADFDSFVHAWQRRPQDTLRHFSRMALQGCPEPRTLRSLLPEWVDETLPMAVGANALEWLEQTDLAPYWAKKQYLCGHLFADHDALVPCHAAEALREMSEGVEVLTDTGHLFPVTHATEVAAYVAEHLKHGGSA